jgi:ATP-dependent Clp protease protease subunit
MTKFWKWTNQSDDSPQRTLHLEGVIASESWWGDEVTPQMFKDELEAGDGDIVVWINSPGGDVIAGAQIYNMLMDYKGNVTVKIDGIAASAASVIAMAGTTVEMSPVSLLMIHNPATFAWGESEDMLRAMEMLGEVKESIINAYDIKTGLPRSEISTLMDAETWMNANKAVELGFADKIMARKGESVMNSASPTTLLFSRVAVTNSLKEKLLKKSNIPKAQQPKGTPADSLMERLDLIKNWR